MLFRNLQAHETAAITACLRPVSFKSGTSVLRRGIWHGQLYIVVSGLVSVLVQEGVENEQLQYLPSNIIAQLGPGECFGEMSLITGDPPSATVRAERDTVLWSLTHRDFMNLISMCPTLLHNMNTILTRRLVRMNHYIPSLQTAEKVWLALVETPNNPLERSLARHIADALAVRSRKRVLLIDMSEQDAAENLLYATYGGQLRPGLLECARDRNMLQYHRAPTVTPDGWYYPAITTLRTPSAHESSAVQEVSLDLMTGILSVLDDFARYYDYLLLVTSGRTPPALMESVAAYCSRAMLFISATMVDKVGKQNDRRYAENATVPPLTTLLSAASSRPCSLFVAHVPERPTIGVQDSYTRQLDHNVTHLLTSDMFLLDQCWKQQKMLNQLAPQAALTTAVDFVARHIAHQTVGLAFGGGGARGFAHLGMLKQLLCSNIPVDYVAACSIGIIAPSMYLLGKSFAESEALFLDIQRHIVRWRLSRTSILSNRGLKRQLLQHCGNVCFEDLTRPFAIVAVDLVTRAEVIVDRGPLWQAALASISLPGIFPPVEIGEYLLVDAGIHDPVPVRPVRRMGADILLALDLHGHEPLSIKNATSWLGTEERAFTKRLTKRPHIPHIVDILARSYEIGMTTISMHSNYEADVVIRPRTLDVSLLQFSKGPRLIAAGQEAVEEALPSLQKLLPWL
ncbi:MAG TPA: cyclic nucleotide-binding and patatin-like phospholipase domain-containing protein [Ktedonobacteraceae bacterium]|nr:cyclic nucleotide-binding and patatin-like phospholipase domain-containing protein [Ktedonobacteraceae bacterium]